ncbi:MAG: hypothetical protein WBW38_13180 [Candidatus Sulfotelmatobacter sp.]
MRRSNRRSVWNTPIPSLTGTMEWVRISSCGAFNVFVVRDTLALAITIPVISGT